MRKPVRHLVFDTNALLFPIELHKIADHFYAPPGVYAEVRCARSRLKIDTFPFEINWREPSTAAMHAVVEDAKKTGNLKELSAVDLKVIALTYDLYLEHCTESQATGVNATIDQLQAAVDELNLESSTQNEDSTAEVEKTEITHPSHLPEGFCDADDSDGEDGWITSDTLQNALHKMGAIEVAGDVVVGCLSTDFAVQNVLLHMHLELVSWAGYRIKTVQTYVLRCRACFNVTSVMEKEFCPKCGNKSLHKCAVSLDKDGNQQLHVNYERLKNLRGLKYSMAPPKGGKHAIVEKIVEDQRMPDQRAAKLRSTMAHDDCFALHDVTSRSAILGIRGSQNRRRNPNESRPNTGNGKRKNKK